MRVWPVELGSSSCGRPRTTVSSAGTPPSVLRLLAEDIHAVSVYRSASIAPFTYIGVSYMSSDLLAMYLSYCKTQRLPFINRQSFLVFLSSRPLLVFHHTVLIFGYPLLVVGLLPSLMLLRLLSLCV